MDGTPYAVVGAHDEKQGMPDPAIQSSAFTPRRAAIAGSIGNVLEWYDFAVYAFFAGTFGRLFFPHSNEIDSLIAAFGVFAAGYLMRPLGGIVFGHIGDRYGRKPVLVISTLAMAVPTFAIGLLPTAAQIGPVAAVLLVVMRLLQGLSIGGEYTGSVCYCAECAKPGKRGLMCTASILGAGIGTLMGSAMADLVNAVLPIDAVDSWGWRIPFLAGALIGVVGWYLRRNLPETRSALAPQEPSRPPIIDTLVNYWGIVLRVVGLNLMHAVSFFMIFIFMKTYLHEFVGLKETQALTISTLGLLALMLVTVVSGALSDRIGRKPVLIASAIAAIVFTYPLLILVNIGSFWVALACQFAFAVIVGAYSGTAPSTMNEMVPGHVRVTGTSLGYNLCMALFGGTTPMITVFLIKVIGTNMAPAFYIMVAAAISLAVVLSIEETSRRALN
jgi:MFS transporter, MHS family, proline/betaine transporter